MQYLKTLFLSLCILSFLSNSAQKTNAEKILGCWVFKEIQFNNHENFSKELIKQAERSVVCFSSDGRIIMTKTADDTSPISGSFKISNDGKTLVQKRDLSDEGTIDDDAEIDFLDDKLLVFKVEFGKIAFERK